MKADTTEFNRGFTVNKPFFIVSRMPMNRVAYTNSNNVTLKRLNRRALTM
jgi:hypothetical protein